MQRIILRVKEASDVELLSSPSSKVGFEIEKVLSRATTVENCIKFMQIRDLGEHAISQEGATRIQIP